MAAESIKKKQITQRRPRRKVPQKGSKAEAILTLATTTPAKPIEIAQSLNTSIQNVSITLKRYGVDHKATESFRNHRAEIFAGLQDKILQTVEMDDIKAASVLQRVTAAGILYDKERLEMGKSTQNIGALIGMIHEIRQSERDEDNAPTNNVIDIT